MPKSSKLSSPLADRFSKAVDPAKPRIIASSSGEVGTGKTSFWLGAPGPIVVMSFDQGLEGVIERFQDDKEIYVKEYAWSPGEYGDDDDAAKAAAELLRDEFFEDFEAALKYARTVLWDKETNIWELFRYAEFGAPNDAPRNYPKLNQRYRHLVNLPKATLVNFGAIQSLKDEWVTKMKGDGQTKGVFSGNRVRQGFSELPELVHIDLFHRRETRENDDGEKESVFLLDVGKSRGPGGQNVQDTTQEGIDFVTFAQMVFPGTSESDWE